MQEEYNDTEFILVPAKEAVRPAEREALYYLHRVLVVGDTSLSERGREAPKSLDVLGVIEASQYRVSREREFLSSLPVPRAKGSSSSFYRPRRRKLHV